MSYELNVEARTAKGSSSARRLRYSGFVPGIVFGAGKDPLPVSVPKKDLNNECNTSTFFNKVFTLNIGSEKEKVLPKDISRHPVTGDILHVDFMRVSKDTKIKIFVPVETINEDKAPGIKKGGIVNLVVHKLECLCDPESIPEKIVLDLSGKEIGESFSLDAVFLPNGVVAVNSERDNVLATIVTSKVGEDDENKTTASATTVPPESSVTKTPTPKA